MGAMHPIFYETMAINLNARSFALRDFVLVMREHQIFAAKVNIKAGPEQFHAHRAAFDVPAWTSFAPGTGPENVAVFRHASFPQGKVSYGFLRILVIAHSFARSHFIEIQFHKLPVFVAAVSIFFDAEINRTIAGPVGEAGVQQFLDEREDFRDVLGCPWGLRGETAV